MKTQKYRGVANPRYAREMHELRSSGASGAHEDKRTKRKRSRKARKDFYIKDSFSSYKKNLSTTSY